jgi:hypothetical protein
MDHITDPVGAGEADLGHLGDRHALGGQQNHLRPTPGHHGSVAPAHDAKQPLPLVVIDLPNPYSLGHPIRMTEVASSDRQSGGVSDQRGKQTQVRH